MPSANEMYSKTFRKEDFQVAPRVLTVSKVEPKEFENAKGPEMKLVLYFLEDRRGCVCSRDRKNAMVAIAGDDYGKWPGTQVELFYDPTIKDPRGGRGGIAIRPAPKTKAN